MGGGWVATFFLFFSPLNLKVPISRNTSSPHLFFLLLPKLIESSVAFLPACSRKLIECELDLKGAGLLCFEREKKERGKKDRETDFLSLSVSEQNRDEDSAKGNYN